MKRFTPQQVMTTVVNSFYEALAVKLGDQSVDAAKERDRLLENAIHWLNESLCPETDPLSNLGRAIHDAGLLAFVEWHERKRAAEDDQITNQSRTVESAALYAGMSESMLNPYWKGDKMPGRKSIVWVKSKIQDRKME